ncbi:hypothetical protein RSOLAG22IIIB_04997 [Rhizoctonia solani]|uniref:Uncharacterized protein n=1 Tax=Rhizoctonia solani TaxID=456999 RepID=A0A0K6G2D5_9AGAM|nr:hypothetical protein RSOLAG22IIIB_04997 [Rhizoctonia solani]
MAQDALRLSNTLAQTNLEYMRQQKAFRTRNFARGRRGGVQFRRNGRAFEGLAMAPTVVSIGWWRAIATELDSSSSTSGKVTSSEGVLLVEGTEVDLDEGISDGGISVNAFELLLGPLAPHLPPGLPPLGAGAPVLPVSQVHQGVADQVLPLPTTLPPDLDVPDGHPGPRNDPVLTPGPFPLRASEPVHEPAPAPHLEIPGPIERAPLSPPLRPAPGPNGPDLPSRAAQKGLPNASEHPGIEGQRDHRHDIGHSGALVEHQGKPSNALALRSVEAPESSVGTERGSTSGSEWGSEPTKAERRNDAVVADVTDHVARWTKVGDDVEMHDTVKALKTAQPEQHCVSP